MDSTICDTPNVSGFADGNAICAPFRSASANSGNGIRRVNAAESASRSWKFSRHVPAVRFMPVTNIESGVVRLLTYVTGVSRICGSDRRVR